MSDIESALLKRTRANAGVIAIAGVFGGEPAIDFDERKSDEDAAFPAAIQTLISPGVNYDQDRRSATQQALVRFEVFGLTSSQSFELAQAIIAANEPAATHDGVRFGRGFEIRNLSTGPETVGERAIYRRIIDMEITATIL